MIDGNKKTLSLTLLEKVVAVLVVLGLCFLSFRDAKGESVQGEAQEFKIKAAFIYQFTKFVEWPMDQAGPKREQFIISVVGESPLFDLLKAVSTDRTVKGKRIEVFRAENAAGLKPSDIVVIGLVSAKESQDILKKAKGQSALTLSAQSPGTEAGVMIQFYLEDGRVRFQISRHAVETEGLKVSSQLTRLARMVD